MKVTLTAEWLWQGTSYGPGDCEVPDALAAALGLTEQQAETQTMPPAARTTRPKRKPHVPNDPSGPS